MKEEKVTITKKKVGSKTPTKRGGIVQRRKSPELNVRAPEERTAAVSKDKTAAKEAEAIQQKNPTLETEVEKQEKPNSQRKIEVDEKQEKTDNQVTIEEKDTPEAAKEKLPEITLDGFASVTASSRSRSGAGVITLVNSIKNGKRFSISKELMHRFSSPTKIKIALSENEIAIGENIPDAKQFSVREYETKGFIYSADLIEELTEHFNLDFSDRVSITFYKVRYVTVEGSLVAIIPINEEEVTE